MLLSVGRVRVHQFIVNFDSFQIVAVSPNVLKVCSCPFVLEQRGRSWISGFSFSFPASEAFPEVLPGLVELWWMLVFLGRLGRFNFKKYFSTPYKKVRIQLAFQRNILGCWEEWLKLCQDISCCMLIVAKIVLIPDYFGCGELGISVGVLLLLAAWVSAGHS